ncbi:O-antigen ligase family protein [Bacillus suaedae]|uniref:O-antigen ligase domain-containing protein n=1 Tax=Halalkalibacter suaedae TaxID=2822140 RepID=A0A941AMP6_9BACI|nr:hypothetical protein [Bacillus suaedae]MBP3950066.1 hypothetical protein [Bacillus suaedae]
MAKLTDFLQSNLEKIILVLMAIFMFLAPFSVSRIYQTLLPAPTSVLVTFLSGFGLLFLIVYFKYVSKQSSLLNPLDKEQRAFVLALYIPGLIAILAGAYNLTVVLSSEYVEYFTASLPTRVINMLLFLILFVCFLKFISLLSNQTLESIAKAYVYGIFVIILFGIWQFLHFLIGYPMFTLDTRSFVHSVNSDVLFNFRLTSLTDEPSYLVPFLIDGLLIAFFFFKSKLRYFIQFFLPGMFVLIFSFAVSGYANLAMVIAFIVLILITARMPNKKKVFIYSCYGLIPLIIIGLFNTGLVMQFLSPILGRVETIFDIQHHSRLYMLVMPFFWLFDYSIINSIFGFGPGGYEFLNLTKFLHHRGSVAVTSNNVFIDILFEHGIFGFIVFTTMFVTIGVKLFLKRNENNYYLYAIILWFHLAVTSLYRSDFASPRFWAVIIIMFIIMELAKRRSVKTSIK